VYIKKEDKQVKERGKKRRRQSEINSWQLLLMMISLGGGNYVQPNEKYLTSLRSTQVIISVYVTRWGGETPAICITFTPSQTSLQNNSSHQEGHGKRNALVKNNR